MLCPLLVGRPPRDPPRRDAIAGPPFSVDEGEVRALFSGRRRVTRLESRERLEDEARLAERGLTQLQEHAFLLTQP